jgi:hypothetical protein
MPAFVIGMIVAVRFLRGQLPSRRESVVIGVVLLVCALGALYFGGEEMSWGQAYFHWQTPEGWSDINKQNETNLHNLELLKYGPWVDLLDDLVSNVPRQMLMAFAIVGIIAPPVLAKKRRTGGFRGSCADWLMPTWSLFPICVLSVCSDLPEKVLKAFHVGMGMEVKRTYWLTAFVEPGGELKEYCYGMLMLLYFLSLLLRTSPARPAQPGAEPVGEPT